MTPILARFTEACSALAAPLKVIALKRGTKAQAAAMASTASSRLEMWRVMPVSSITTWSEPACKVRPARSVGSMLMKQSARTPGLDRPDGPDPALELADHIFEDHVALEAHAGVEERLHRHEGSGVAGLHVRDADAVDEPVVVDAAPRVDRPARR